jgi:hypothetical protein
MGFAVTKVNMYVPQGATYAHNFLYRQESDESVISLNGYTARLHIREKVTSPSTLYEASTDDGDGITITGPTGEVYLEIPAATTAAWTWTKAVYDLEIISGAGKVTRIAEGNVKVSPEVTR